MTAAMSFLGRGRRGDWLTIAMGDRQRPQTCTELREAARAHFNAIPEGKATGRLCRVRQLTTVQDSLTGLGKAAAECQNLLAKEKTNVFAKGLGAERVGG